MDSGRTLTVLSRRLLLASLALILEASGTSAATLVVDGGGNLLGATDISVGGALYDVTFVEGTCSALFDGCDDPTDFVFQTLESSTLASQALLDQVFVDGLEGLFDSSPFLTAGCGDTDECYVHTPWSTDGIQADSTAAHNTSPTAITFPEGVGESVFSVDYDFAPDQTDTLALWSTVPEPSPGLLVAAGLAMLRPRRRSGGIA